MAQSGERLAPMNQLELAARLPHLRARAARDALVGALGYSQRWAERSLAAAAAARFEALVSEEIRDGVRPGLLFDARDALSAGMRDFARSALARRLRRLRPAQILARGAKARPFDALVRARDGRSVAVVMRPMPTGEARLDIYRALRTAIERAGGSSVLTALLLIDPLTGASQSMRLDEIARLQRGSTAA